MQISDEGMNHSWNIVWLDGQVRHIDVTWDDTGGARPGDRTYFLRTADEMRALGHSWRTDFITPMEEVRWTLAQSGADALHTLGMFNGTDVGFELERAPTRAEAGLMLLRLMGLEDEAAALGPTLPCPFTDVNAFYRPYIAYLYDRGLSHGTSATTFSPQQTMTLDQYLTFVLRALGYDDSIGDFVWQGALQAAVDFGLLPAWQAAAFGVQDFNRGVMAYASLCALLTPMADGAQTLGQALAAAGAIDSAIFLEISLDKGARVGV
jgi:hypothetical protein